MKEVWALMDGNEAIARNHIPEAQGLEAVRYCEDMVVRLFVDDLEQAHNDAINYSRRKFIGGTGTNQTTKNPQSIDLDCGFLLEFFPSEDAIAPLFQQGICKTKKPVISNEITGFLIR